MTQPRYNHSVSCLHPRDGVSIGTRNLSSSRILDASESLTRVAMPRPKACVVYVGDLPSDVRTREIEDVFYKVHCSNPLPVAAHVGTFSQH